MRELYDYPDAVTARRLKEIIAEKNLTQTQVAKMCNRDRKAVNAWVNCYTSPDCYSLKKICARLNVSADYIMGISDVKEAHR